MPPATRATWSSSASADVMTRSGSSVFYSYDFAAATAESDTTGRTQFACYAFMCVVGWSTTVAVAAVLGAALESHLKFDVSALIPLYTKGRAC
jgi:hypothetical protein